MSSSAVARQDEQAQLDSVAQEVKDITGRIKRLRERCTFSSDEEDKERKFSKRLYEKFNENEYNAEAIVVTGLLFGSSSSLAESLSVRFEDD